MTNKCSIDDCVKEARHKGWCTTHYKRWWRHGNPLQCAYDRTLICKYCGEPARTMGYCGPCYTRYNRNGTPNRQRLPNGSPRKIKGGYIYRTVSKNKLQYEHITIAEKALGKPLPKGAEVHHVNRIRSDNRPENLVICPSHAYHMLLHARQRKLT